MNWKDDPKVGAAWTKVLNGFDLLVRQWYRGSGAGHIPSIESPLADLCEAVAASVPSAGGGSVATIRNIVVQGFDAGSVAEKRKAVLEVAADFADAKVEESQGADAMGAEGLAIALNVAVDELIAAAQLPFTVSATADGLAASSPGTGAVTEAMLVDVRDAILGKTGEGDPPSLATLNALQKFDRLTAALSGAGRDRERLDWLAQYLTDDTTLCPPGNHGGKVENWLVNRNNLNGGIGNNEWEAPTLREAIDAARSASTPPSEEK